MGAPGCQQRIERCSVLIAKSLIKQIETISSQAAGVNIKNFSIYTVSDLGALSNLIGSLSLANEHYSPPTE